MKLAWFCFWLLLPSLAFAITLENRGSAEVEARVLALSKALKCPVCEGQPVSESRAPLAVDIRHAVRLWVEEGRSDAEILTALQGRYGGAILLDDGSSVQKSGFLFGIPLLLLFAGILVQLVLRRGKTA